MPNKTVYIRKENELSWDSLENKSDWVNDKLSSATQVVTVSRSDVPMTADNPSQLAPMTVFEGKPIITPRNQHMKFCSHGTVKGFCKKGCK